MSIPTTDVTPVQFIPSVDVATLDDALPAVPDCPPETHIEPFVLNAYTAPPVPLNIVFTFPTPFQDVVSVE